MLASEIRLRSSETNAECEGYRCESESNGYVVLIVLTHNTKLFTEWEVERTRGVHMDKERVSNETTRWREQHPRRIIIIINHCLNTSK